MTRPIAAVAAEALEVAKLALIDIADEEEPGEPAFCVKCNIHVRTDPEMDPSPMCNPCAQDACAELARAVLAMSAVVEAAREWRKVLQKEPGAPALWERSLVDAIDALDDEPDALSALDKERA